MNNVTTPAGGSAHADHGITIEVRHKPAMHYVALCLCGWLSADRPTRRLASVDGQCHDSQQARSEAQKLREQIEARSEGVAISDTLERGTRSASNLIERYRSNLAALQPTIDAMRAEASCGYVTGGQAR